MNGIPEPMLELFRSEVQTNAAIVRIGASESSERAAQQIRGAALIVGRSDIAEIAAVLQVAYAAERRGGKPTDPRSLDAKLSEIEALAAVDRLTELPGEAVPLESTSIEEPVLEPEPEEQLDAGATTLMELFREEVKNLCATLADGLVTLEEDPTDPRRIEPLMRAAHSIKGAARIVGIDPGVDLAHVMEELLVAAQHGKHLLTAEHIDALLHAVDLLAELGRSNLKAWAKANDARTTAAVRNLEAAIAGQTLAEAPPAPVLMQPSTLEEAAPEAVVEVAAPLDEDRVVRISAKSLSRLLSLAGESLVEAHWLQPFTQSLLRLKKQQDHIAEALEDMHRELNVPNARAERLVRTSEETLKQLTDCRRGLVARIEEFETHARQSDDLNTRLYREIIAGRMRPFADGTHGVQRMVRDVARLLGKKVKFEVLGQATDVDRDILDKLEAPLGHMLRNALDHGLESAEERLAAGKPETGSLKLEARHQAGMLNIRVTEDGRGIDLAKLRKKVVAKGLTSRDLAARLSDPELLDFLFLPGFSTAEQITDVSGRGVGLDAVQAMAQAVGGVIRIHTVLGKGTTFELQLPITLSVLRAVLVRIAGDPYALPLNRTDRLLKLRPDAVRTLEGKAHFDADGKPIGLVPVHRLLDLPASETRREDDLTVVVVSDRLHQYGLLVDDFLGEQDLVVRPLDARLGKIPNVNAAALLDDGSPVLILDVDDLARSAASLVQDGQLRHERGVRTVVVRKKRVLVVDDSAIVREAERQLLLGRGYDVDLAVDGLDGLNALKQGEYDLVVSDIDMPRMTGLEFVRAIRIESRIQSLPVVIVSYKDRDDDRLRGLQAGANAYLTKSSFHDGKFLDTIEDLIGPAEHHAN